MEVTPRLVYSGMTLDERCGGDTPTLVTFAIQKSHIIDLLDVITIAKKA